MCIEFAYCKHLSINFDTEKKTALECFGNDYIMKIYSIKLLQNKMHYYRLLKLPNRNFTL